MVTLSSMLLQKGHLVPDLLEQRYREHIYMYLHMYICESFFFKSGSSIPYMLSYNLSYVPSTNF